MKLSKGVENFWAQISYIFLVGAAAALMTFGVFGLRAAGLAVAIGVVWVIWFLHETKSRMLQGLSDGWTVKPVSLEAIPSLDLDWLQQQTATLESLGFVRLMDYERLEYAQTFGRCFAHPQHDCFAEIGQLPKTSSAAPVKHLTIFSLLDQGWRLGVVNRPPIASDSLHLLWYNPKTITILDPNSSLEQVFQTHLRSRRQVITDLEITVLPDVSWEAYTTFNQKIATDIKRTFKRRNLLVGMIKATLYELNPQPDWFLGAYPTLAAKRRARNR